VLANAPVNGYLYTFPFCMIRILLLLSFALFVAGCSKHTPYYYTITGLQLYNSDNAGEAPVDAKTNDVPAKSYAIRLEFNHQLADSLKGQDDESGFSVLNPVHLFTVTSLTDFDPTHPAGSELNNYFLYKVYSQSISSGDSIAAYVASGTIGAGGVFGSFKVPETWTTDQYLLLMHPPAYFGSRSFVIYAETTDNIRLRDTITVNLLP
jgi:hypothetical protein